jgi:hypothetical protein
MVLFFAGGAMVAFFLHMIRSGGPIAVAEVTGGGGATAVGLSQRAMVYAVGTAFVLVLASEVLGRMLFYTANVRIGF